jgi:hypothetical protein
MDRRRAEKVSRALADATMLSILEAISARKEITCGDVASLQGITPATVSHHLKVLADAGSDQVSARGSIRHQSRHRPSNAAIHAILGSDESTQAVVVASDFIQLRLLKPDNGPQCRLLFASTTYRVSRWTRYWYCSLVLEQMSSMGDRRSRTHGRRNGRRFGQHLVRCSRIPGRFHVQFDTVWTLRRKGDSHSHELFV